MSARKKWSTTWGNPALPRKSHRSERAVYDWVAEQAGRVRRGHGIGSTVVIVWVDEGRGWERYERVDLREHEVV